MINTKVQPILAELRQRLKALYGPRLVKMILYGSQARGDAEPGSDIDVLVVLCGNVAPADEINRTSKVIADLSLQNDTVVSCAFMDEVRFTTRNGPFLRNIRREGVTI